MEIHRTSNSIELTELKCKDHQQNYKIVITQVRLFGMVAVAVKYGSGTYFFNTLAEAMTDLKDFLYAEEMAQLVRVLE